MAKHLQVIEQFLTDKGIPFQFDIEKNLLMLLFNGLHGGAYCMFHFEREMIDFYSIYPWKVGEQYQSNVQTALLEINSELTSGIFYFDEMTKSVAFNHSFYFAYTDKCMEKRLLEEFSSFAINSISQYSQKIKIAAGFDLLN